MTEINKDVAKVKGDVREKNWSPTPTHSIRCRNADFETVSIWLKKVDRTWSSLVEIIARELREKSYVELAEVFKKTVLLEEKRDRSVNI